MSTRVKLLAGVPNDGNRDYLPEAIKGTGEHADKAVPLRQQYPGGVDRVAPAGHQAAVHTEYQGRLFVGVVFIG